MKTKVSASFRINLQPSRKCTTSAGRNNTSVTGPMYVCNCNALTEKQIRVAIANRPRDEAAVYRYYDCQPQCGRCVCEVREMLRQAREAKAAA